MRIDLMLRASSPTTREPDARPASPARSPLRIALLTETYAPVVGGGETQARLLAEGLAAAGARVAIVTRRTSRELARRERLGGVLVRRVGPAGRHHLNKWALAASVPLAAGRLLVAADVLLVSGFRVLGVPARMAALAGRVPVVLKADNRGELSGRFFDRGLERLGIAPDAALVRAAISARNRLFRGAAAWVAISEEIAEEYRDHGVPAERIHRIPNGFDPAQFRPASRPEREALRRRLAIPARVRVICYTGRLVDYKGLFTLVRAWRDIVADRPEALLVLVGEGGLDIHACENALRDFVRANGLARHVRFTGPVSDVDAYLRAADGFVLPSEKEAFGLSLVEAMACGLPCVATPVGAMREIVDHGRTGWLVPAADGGALQEALELILAGGVGVASVGAAATTAARRHFTAGAVVSAYESLFRRLSEA